VRLRLSVSQSLTPSESDCECDPLSVSHSVIHTLTLTSTTGHHVTVNTYNDKHSYFVSHYSQDTAFINSDL